MALDVRAKRIYDPPEDTDGYRVLIDHIWPRGVSRERAKLDEWAKELAPSDELRKWFDHDPARFAEFRSRYRDELAAQSERLGDLRRQATSDLKELAPSDELRKWFDHDPARFAEFRSRYRDELAAQSERLGDLRRQATSGPLTILYAARDQEHNNAVVVCELLRDA